VYLAFVSRVVYRYLRFHYERYCKAIESLLVIPKDADPEKAKIAQAILLLFDPDVVTVYQDLLTSKQFSDLHGMTRRKGHYMFLS